jgi:hypothetical protein
LTKINNKKLLEQVVYMLQKNPMNGHLKML